jgi:hypothetical protein
MNSDDLITSSTAGLPLSENHSTFKKLVFLQSEKKDQKIALEASSPFDDNEEQEVESDESALFGRNRSIYSRRSSSPQSSWKSTLMRAVGGKKK